MKLSSLNPIFLICMSIVTISECAPFMNWMRQRLWQDNQEPLYYFSMPTNDLLNTQNSDIGYYYYLPLNGNTNIPVTTNNVNQYTNKQGTPNNMVQNSNNQYYLLQSDPIQYPNPFQFYLTPNKLIPNYVYNSASYSQNCYLYPWSSYCTYKTALDTPPTVRYTTPGISVAPRSSSRNTPWLYYAVNNIISKRSHSS